MKTPLLRRLRRRTKRTELNSVCPRPAAPRTETPSDAVPNAGTGTDMGIPGDTRREQLLHVLHRISLTRRKRPVDNLTLSPGSRCCTSTGAMGIIRDIDYIHSRILVDFNEADGPRWLPLAMITAMADR